MRTAHDLEVLPGWPPGTVAILATGGPAPHAIPVSTGVRAAPRRVLFALGRRRESLERLRRDPRAALTFLCGSDIAFTAHGTAATVQEPMEVSNAVVAVALEVDRIQDHYRPDFTVEAGVRWRWTDPEAARRDARIRDALNALAGSAETNA